MARYFFHLHSSGAKDIDGQNFPDDRAACEEARLVARDLCRSRVFTADEKLVVTNDKGEVIHEECLAKNKR
ncbi:MAG TPA: hypothetical protein VFA57_19965 [Pseudolabrys sp.]|nr:hypothetical protein [Pseudolabrys sp.]